jgi:hypothetical protein
LIDHKVTMTNQYNSIANLLPVIFTRVHDTFQTVKVATISFFDPSKPEFYHRVTGFALVAFLAVISYMFVNFLDNILFFYVFYNTVQYMSDTSLIGTTLGIDTMRRLLSGWLVYGAIVMFGDVLHGLLNIVGFGFVITCVKIALYYKLVAGENVIDWVSNATCSTYRLNKASIDLIYASCRSCISNIINMRNNTIESITSTTSKD